MNLIKKYIRARILTYRIRLAEWILPQRVAIIPDELSKQIKELSDFKNTMIKKLGCKFLYEIVVQDKDVNVREEKGNYTH